MSWQTVLLLSTVEVLVLAVAGLGVSDGRLEPGQLLAAVGYVALAMAGFDSLDTATQVVQARVGVARLSEDDGGPAARLGRQLGRLTTLPAEGTGELHFDDVTVRRDGHAVIDRVTLTVPAGASVAIVGRSGSGKSTLAGLLGRLVEADEGRVLIDGTAHRVPELQRAPRGSLIRVRPTRPPRLHGGRAHHPGSIGPGRPAAARARTTEAARTAHADDFIRRLPEGYDTPLGRAPFSGGELQRLGIAQALVRPARVLVFDDATSSLDTATELEVMAAVEEASAGRTRLTVTHRVATAARPTSWSGWKRAG